MDTVPEIKYIDFDLGQLDYYETRPMVSFPCVLIDFTNAEFTNEGQHVQWANIVIHFKIGFSPFSSATSFSPDISKEKALEFFEIENKLYTQLQGWKPTMEVSGNEVEICQELIRTSASTEKRNDPFRIRLMRMVTAGEDSGAKDVLNSQQTTLNIT